MTDLSGSIEGITTERIASYFDCDKQVVQRAINEGARTYQDIWNSLQAIKKRREASAKNEHRHLSPD